MVTVPPIRASSVEGPHAQPTAIVIGVVVWTINPDPYAIPEDPTATSVVEVMVVIMTTLSRASMITVALEVTMVAVAFCKSTAVAIVRTTVRTFTTVLAASTAFIHSVTTGTRPATHALTAAWATAGRGRTASATAAHVAAAASASAAATSTSTAAASS